MDVRSRVDAKPCWAILGDDVSFIQDVGTLCGVPIDNQRSLSPPEEAVFDKEIDFRKQGSEHKVVQRT